ncbi:MAG: hypothetical protein ACFE0P_00430 [Oceanicaulis sp.]
MGRSRKRRNNVDATGRTVKGERFYRLQHSMLESPAWRSLTCAQRCVYLALAQFFTGSNNGQIGMSVRQAADLAGCHKDTAGEALKVLEDRGFIARQTLGAFSMKIQHASEWRLTAHPAGSDQHGTRDYLNWKPEEKSRSGLKGQTVRFEGTGCADLRDTG